MKDTNNSLIKERMYRDANLLKSRSNLDVIDKVILKIKAQNSNILKIEKQSIKPKLFTHWKVPVVVSIVILSMVFINYSNFDNGSNPSLVSTSDINLIAQQEVVASNEQKKNLVMSETQALTNDLAYLSNVINL